MATAQSASRQAATRMRSRQRDVPVDGRVLPPVARQSAPKLLNHRRATIDLAGGAGREGRLRRQRRCLRRDRRLGRRTRQRRLRRRQRRLAARNRRYGRLGRQRRLHARRGVRVDRLVHRHGCLRQRRLGRQAGRVDRGLRRVRRNHGRHRRLAVTGQQVLRGGRTADRGGHRRNGSGQGGDARRGQSTAEPGQSLAATHQVGRVRLPGLQVVLECAAYPLLVTHQCPPTPVSIRSGARRSLASARDAVLFTVPGAIPSSSAVSASERSCE